MSDSSNKKVAGAAVSDSMTDSDNTYPLVAVPWYDTVDTSDVENDMSIDEMIREVDRCIEDGRELLNEVDFEQGNMIRKYPATFGYDSTGEFLSTIFPERY